MTYSIKEPTKHKLCNQLCLLTEEGRAKLVNLRESLRAVHALQREKLGDIKTLEARIKVDLAGLGTSTEQEAELEEQRWSIENLLTGLRDNYQRRLCILYGNLKVKSQESIRGHQQK